MRQPSKKSKKNNKPTVGCGIKQPVVVRHKVPAKSSHLSQQSVAKMYSPTIYSGPPTVNSGLRRGIGSGMLYSQSKNNTDWPGLERPDDLINNRNKVLAEQKKAKEMLQTLSNEVNGLNRDKELMKRATQNADRALKKTVDYLSPVRVGSDGFKIQTDGVRKAEAPEDVFLRVLSPSKETKLEEENQENNQEGEGEDQDCQRMRTPTRKIEYSDEYNNINDTERVLEMSPPLVRYDPTRIQHTFEMNLDGITLEELERMKFQNEDRIKDIENRFFTSNQNLEEDVMKMTNYTRDEQYIIKINNSDVKIPINSFAELNADMLNFDTNESEPDENVHTYSKRLMYELKFEKYLKSKIKSEIVHREKFQKEKYIAPEDKLKQDKKSHIEEMVRTRMEGKTLTPEEEEMMNIINQAKIDADDEYMIIIKQIFTDMLNDSENMPPNQADEDSYEARPAQSANKNDFVEKVLAAPKAEPFLQNIAREPMGVSEIQKETFEEVLRRIQKNYNKSFIIWEKILPYFTRKGTQVSEFDLRKLDTSGV